MTKMSKTPHVLNLISEYVLELLPRDESDRVAHHLARCQECHQAMTLERELGRTVRTTLRAASEPHKDRLRQLRPASPAPFEWFTLRPIRSLGLAAVGLLLLLVFGAIGLYFNHQPIMWTLEQPTVGSTAVLMTDTPTQTATRSIAATADADALAPESMLEHPASAQRAAPEIQPKLAPAPAAFLRN